jgi:hypothetical protein
LTFAQQKVDRPRIPVAAAAVVVVGRRPPAVVGLLAVGGEEGLRVLLLSPRHVADGSWCATAGTRGQFFVHFFPRKITFRGKFRGISWKNNFSKLFPRKIQLFPNIFGGKFSAEFSLKIFTGKNVRKIGH